MQEIEGIQGQSLGGEDPLEEGMATHSSILAWRIPWAEEPRGLQFMGLQRVRHDWSDWVPTQWYTTSAHAASCLHPWPSINTIDQVVRWPPYTKSQRPVCLTPGCHWGPFPAVQPWTTDLMLSNVLTFCCLDISYLLISLFHFKKKHLLGFLSLLLFPQTQIFWRWRCCTVGNGTNRTMFQFQLLLLLLLSRFSRVRLCATP